MSDTNDHPADMPIGDLFFQTARFPTAARPLLGMTVLVVEDSRYTSDAVRLMCLRSGARIRRADSLAAAARHLQVYHPTVVLVDIGLPDGNGLDLISTLSEHSQRIEVILAISGDDWAEQAALAAGADGFLSKPVASLAAFQEQVLRHLPAARRPMDPRMVNDAAIHPDPASYTEDLLHAASILAQHPSGAELDYVCQFLKGLCRSAGDNELQGLVQRLNVARLRPKGPKRALAALRNLLAARIANPDLLEQRI